MSISNGRHRNAIDPIGRFSVRAEDYGSFRPDYPEILLHHLRERCGLTPAWVVADLGAGSGRLSSIFLANGNSVLALEPNSEMRAIAERELSGFSGVTILDAVAEDTGLADYSVDLIVMGSAFHWFDPATALRESMRILKPEGWLVLARLTRRVATPVERAYEDFLSKYSPDHRRFREHRMDLEERLVECGFVEWNDVESRSMSVDDLLGLSASYSIAPERSHSSFREFEANLRQLFDRFSVNGVVAIGHDLRLHYCQLWSESDGLSRAALDPSYWQNRTEQSKRMK